MLAFFTSFIETPCFNLVLLTVHLPFKEPPRWNDTEMDDVVSDAFSKWFVINIQPQPHINNGMEQRCPGKPQPSKRLHSSLLQIHPLPGRQNMLGVIQLYRTQKNFWGQIRFKWKIQGTKVSFHQKLALLQKISWAQIMIFLVQVTRLHSLGNKCFDVSEPLTFNRL